MTRWHGGSRSLALSAVLVAASPVLAGVADPGLSADDPPHSTLAVIRPAAIRAHMAFLADHILEGRGNG